MNEIEGGMTKIIPALAAGNWDTITHIARMLKNSFILNQRKELHSSLPKEFIAMDRAFHSTAGKLAHAALQYDIANSLISIFTNSTKNVANVIPNMHLHVSLTLKEANVGRL